MVPALLSQCAGVGGGGALRSSTNDSVPLGCVSPVPLLFSTRSCSFNTSRRLKSFPVANAAEPSGSGAATKPASSTPPPLSGGDSDSISVVGQESVPLEGVIQFEKPSASSVLAKWGLVSILAGGDVAALLLFSAVGRLNHGFSVLDTETLKTADPFIAGWFLSAYFLGGYSKDGRGLNGRFKAVIAATKSWLFGIPLGLLIRAASSGHLPPTSFILVSMGSTAVLLIGWRAILFSLFPTDKGKKDDAYKRGSPFELFELLTSLVRRW